MSTLEKTINLLNLLPENQIETVYSFAQFLSIQQRESKQVGGGESIEAILDGIVGVVPDTGKTVGDYREERIRERYGVID